MKKFKYISIFAIIIILMMVVGLILTSNNDTPFSVVSSNIPKNMNFSGKSDFFAVNDYKKGMANIYQTNGEDDDEIVVTLKSSDLKSEPLSTKLIGETLYFWQNGSKKNDCNLYKYNTQTGKSEKIQIDSKFIICDIFENEKKEPIIVGDKKSGSNYVGCIYPYREDLVSFTKNGEFLPKGYNFKNQIHIMNKDGVIIYNFLNDNLKSIDFKENYMYESGISTLMFSKESILIPVFNKNGDEPYIEIFDEAKNSISKAYFPSSGDIIFASGRISSVFSVIDKNKDLENYICYTIRYNYEKNTFENFGEKSYSFKDISEKGKPTWRYDYNKRIFTLYDTVSPLRINEILDIK